MNNVLDIRLGAGKTQRILEGGLGENFFSPEKGFPQVAALRKRGVQVLTLGAKNDKLNVTNIDGKQEGWMKCEEMGFDGTG